MNIWRSSDGSMELRLGDWREVLADVKVCDAVIMDPPFGARTHRGQRHKRKESAYTPDKTTLVLAHRGIDYTSMSPEEVEELISGWADRAAWWIAAFTSHDLGPAYERAAHAAGRYPFAPLACVQHARNVRLAGDGPSNWTDWLMVNRPKAAEKWGALPGAYTGPCHDPGQNALDRSKSIVPGAKPVWLMRTIVRDYSRPGDLIIDPYAGGGTTLLAAAMEGRRAIGAEIDPETFEKAVARLSRGYTRDMFA